MTPPDHSKKSRLASWPLKGLTVFVAAAGVVGLISNYGFPPSFVDGQEPSQKKMPQSEHAHTNQLIDETSPYLLQHAHNPVHWHPWGKEAFAKAKRENKPIFLSVGYSTCYWCHVMEVESFEDTEVAAVINEHYIAIKVDREERPDIDEQYMLATQLIVQRGGWPNSVWLTPDGRPWMAGTYFPKQRFIDVLKQLADVWKTRRDEVNLQADALANAVKQMSAPGMADDTELTQQLMTQAASSLAGRFDSTHGGFGIAPKFPPHGTLQVLLREYHETGDKSLLKPITGTLDAMWLGGIHDHIGGGFHRYATDNEWLLPHFEKMLYDNAQLMRAYVDGYEATKTDTYRLAVADIYQWVKREMTSADGAFYSALDSGEVGEEGDAYLWSIKKLRDTLNTEDAKLFAEIYHFESQGNFDDESTGKRIGTNIPHLKRPLELIGQKRGDNKLKERLAELRECLLVERLKWPQPHRDDKVLTGWNGLMIGSLARAGRVLEEPKYIDAAQQAANFILDNMVRKGRLLRTFRDKKARLPAYLDDYAYFIDGLLELHAATTDERWLKQADRFASILVSDFQDSERGGFFFTTSDHEDLLVRSKHLSGGGNMPNPNGVAAQVLIKLAKLTNNPVYHKAAKRTLQSFASLMARQPSNSEDLLVATSLFLANNDADGDKSVGSGTTSKDGEVGERVGPVTLLVKSSSRKISSGDTMTVTVTMDIDEGWHLYAKNPKAEFLQPSAVVVVANERITIGEVVPPESHRAMDSVSKQTLSTYVDRVEFKVPVTVRKDAPVAPMSLKIKVTMQACDDQRCLPVTTTTIELPIDVVAMPTVLERDE